MTQSHPLLHPRLGFALGAGGIVGLGALLMDHKLYPLGLALCLLSAAAICSLYWREWAKPFQKTSYTIARDAIIAPVFVILYVAIPLLIGPASDDRVARLIVTNIQILANESPIKFNFYVQNSGALTSIGFAQTSSSVILDRELNNKELDDVFVKLVGSLLSSTKPDDDRELQPTESRWFTFGFSVTPDQYQSVTNGNNYLYLFEGLAYRDSNTPQGKWRLSELCYFTYKGQGIHACLRHNRIYLSD